MSHHFCLLLLCAYYFVFIITQGNAWVLRAKQNENRLSGLRTLPLTRFSAVKKFPKPTELQSKFSTPGCCAQILHLVLGGKQLFGMPRHLLLTMP